MTNSKGGARLYASVVFTFNEQIDAEFVARFFEPCPKVAAVSYFEGGALVTFKSPQDELELELRTFLEPNGMFRATWGKTLTHIDPPELEQMYAANCHKKSTSQEQTPCGSNCLKCPQYRGRCRGCPVTPFYLGDDFALNAI